MKTVMGIINIPENADRVRELTEKRSIASLPFAGRYRIIDFALSSMVNSGIIHVGIMLPDQSRSVLDHLRSGKDWDLARHHEGLFYLPPMKDDRTARDGDLKNFYHHLDFVEHSDQKYVLVANGNMIYNINFANMLRFHQNTGADITMAYHVVTDEHPGGGIVVETAENGLVQDISRKPVLYEGSMASIGAYLMDKRVFVDIVRSAFEHGGTDFVIDCIIRQFRDLAVYACAHDGYTAAINSTASYYKASMDVLQPDVLQELFMNGDSIYTKSKDEVPVQYKDTAHVENSLIANGCIIRGEVENSILFRGVRIGKGVKVSNSILMQKCDLQDDALVENVICDKNVVITKEKWLKGAPNYPLIVNKNIVI